MRALVRHLVAGQLVFARALGSGAGQTSSADGAAAQLSEEFRSSGALMLDGFRRPGVLAELVDIPVGRVPGAVAVDVRITECLVHGWDLARATGQRTDFDDRVVEHEIEFTRGALALIPPDRTPFAPEQPAPTGATAIDRLAALVGRTVVP